MKLAPCYGEFRISPQISSQKPQQLHGNHLQSHKADLQRWAIFSKFLPLYKIFWMKKVPFSARPGVENLSIAPQSVYNRRHIRYDRGVE